MSCNSENCYLQTAAIEMDLRNALEVDWLMEKKKYIRIIKIKPADS